MSSFSRPGKANGAYRHGHKPKAGHASPTYMSWVEMRRRCLNPKHKRYADYGGRGITICEQWRSFEVFLADMGERPPELSLERKDNSLGYSPGNCVWATDITQRRNSRSIKLTIEIARAIRASTESNRVLAAKHGVSDVMIGKIKRNESWKE